MDKTLPLWIGAILAVPVIACDSPSPTAEPPETATIEQSGPEVQPVGSTALRSAIREARKAVRHPDASYAAAVHFAGQAMKEPMSTGWIHAYEATQRAFDVSAETGMVIDRHRTASNEIRGERDQINMRFIQNERDFAVHQDDLDRLKTRQASLDEELATALETRRSAYEAASDEWSALLPESLHPYAAAMAARSVGRNEGWFGEIDEVYSWFMRHSARMSPSSTPVDQRRVYDYGVAMKFYFDLNPIGEHEEKYIEWRRAVDSRLETLGWKNGTPKFSRLTF